MLNRLAFCCIAVTGFLGALPVVASEPPMIKANAETSALLSTPIIAKCNDCAECGTFGHEHLSGTTQAATSHGCQDWSESCQHAACGIGLLGEISVKLAHGATQNHFHNPTTGEHVRVAEASAGGSSESVEVAELRQALQTGDLDLLKQAVARNGSVKYVPQRRAVQVIGCADAIAAHFPLNDEQIRTLSAE